MPASWIRLYVNGITRSLEAAQYHAQNNNQHGLKVNIYNALVEMAALEDELEKPDLIFKFGDDDEVSKPVARGPAFVGVMERENQVWGEDGCSNQI